VGRYQNLLDQVEKMPLTQALPVLSRMHIGYLVSPRELDLPIVTRTPDVTIYRNAQVLPRAWIAPADSDLNSASEIAPGSMIESLTDSGNAVTIRLGSPQDGWLILTDTFYPGWQAAVDGEPLEFRSPIQSFGRSDFRQVRIPSSSSMRPRSVFIGQIVSW
jgi:hypothetical protein